MNGKMITSDFEKCRECDHLDERHELSYGIRVTFKHCKGFSPRSYPSPKISEPRPSRELKLDDPYWFLTKEEREGLERYENLHKEG